MILCLAEEKAKADVNMANNDVIWMTYYIPLHVTLTHMG